MRAGCAKAAEQISLLFEAETLPSDTQVTWYQMAVPVFLHGNGEEV